MVWAILFVLGIPLWFIVVGITVTVARNRKLRARAGNFPARVRRPGKTRWIRGNAIWVSDVFVFRGSPAAWSEDLVHVVSVTLRDPGDEERHQLRHLSDRPQIATLALADGETYDLATSLEHQIHLRGPFGPGEISTTTEEVRPVVVAHDRGGEQ